MNYELKLWLIFGLACFLAIILNLMRRGNLSLRYALTWLISSIIMTLAVFLPELPALLASRFGIIEPVNAVFLLQGLLVMLILLSLTAAVSRLSARNKKLTQQLALLEHRVREIEKNSMKVDEA